MTTSKKPPRVELYRELAAKAHEMLQDKEWHPYVQIERELMKLVPPSMAIRTAETIRVKPRRENRHGEIQARPAVRQRHREPDELVRVGRRSIIRSFLMNPNNYEIDKTIPRGVHAPDWVDDRQIRLVGTSRWLVTEDPAEIAKRQRRFLAEAEAARLKSENEHLRDQVANLRIYLIGLGHEKRANEIAPPEDDDETAD